MVVVRTRLSSIAVHPTCTLTHLGVTDWSCCGFAGDRGMLHPELTASATRPEAAEVTRREFAAYTSANRTCEMGMTRATGRTHRHILELLDDATRY